MYLTDNNSTVAEDFDKITLDESRAVLSIHMLCYVLDGSIGFSEVALVRCQNQIPRFLCV